MAFESLTEKLQNVFKNLRSKGRLTEADVKVALKEVKMALLEADVSFKVVKQFIKAVQERAIGQDVMNGLNPGQMVIKIVNDELVSLMGSETTEIALRPAGEITVIMMAGLQGAGKTTTTAKIAGKLKAKGRKPLLVACDVYRPAAITQLQVNGEKQGVEVFSMGDKQKPVDIAKAAVAEMVRQTGPCEFGADGYIRRGTIVRHLILPGHTRNSREVLNYLHETYGENIYISIMNQYTPVRKFEKFKELNRKVTKREYEKVLDAAVDMGIQNGFIQEGETASESFIPEFDYEGVKKNTP